MRQVEQQHADEALHEAVESTRWWRRSKARWMREYELGCRSALVSAFHAKGHLIEAQGLARTLCGVRWGGCLRLER